MDVADNGHRSGNFQHVVLCQEDLPHSNAQLLDRLGVRELALLQELDALVKFEFAHSLSLSSVCVGRLLRTLHQKIILTSWEEERFLVDCLR